MKTESKVLASFIAAAVWADGEYNEFEKEFVAELGEGLGIKDFDKVLENEIAAVESMSEDELADYLEKNAKGVNAKEKEGVLSICLQALCSSFVPVLCQQVRCLSAVPCRLVLRLVQVCFRQKGCRFLRLYQLCFPRICLRRLYFRR